MVAKSEHFRMTGAAFWWALVFEFGLGALGYVLAKLLGVVPRDHLLPSFPDLFFAFVGTAPVLTLFWLTLYANFEWCRQVRAFLSRVLVPLLENVSLGGLFLLSLGAGIGEELLFRLAIQQGTSGFFGPVSSWLFASFLFGLAHFVTVGYVLLATLMGLYLGACFIVTDNILVPIVIHALYDFVALIWLLRVHAPSAETCASRPLVDERGNDAGDDALNNSKPNPGAND